MLVVGGIFLLSRAAWIAPKQFVDDLFWFGLGVVDNFDRLIYFVELEDGLHRMSNASMRTENVIVNQRSYRKFIKEFVDPIEERILVFDILFEFEGAFIAEAHILVDLPILVRSSQEHDVLRKLYLQREKH